MKSYAETSVFLGAAQYLLAIGLCPVLLSGKQPIFHDYQKYISGVAGSDELALPLEKRPYRYSPGLIEEWARVYPGANVGILTRDRPTVDIDSPHIWDAIKDLLPPTPHCKRGARGFSLIYSQDRLDPVRKTRTFADPFSKQMLVEFLGDGRQTVLPPSIHPETGEAYTWLPVPWWGYMQAVPLSSTVPPALSQAVVDAIDRRLQELGLIKRRVPKGVGLAYTAPPADRYRYEAFFKVKLAEKLAAVRDAQSGTCRDTLNGAVFALAPWVREGFITEEALEDEMRGLCEHNGWIGRDGDKAFKRQYDKALDDGWHKELPVLAERYEVAPAPTGFTMLPGASGGGMAPPAGWMCDGSLPDEEPELIRKLMPAAAGRIAFIAGKGNMGKSFYAIGMAVALAQGPGVKFMGQPVRQRAGTIILAAEDAAGMRVRLYAAMKQAGLSGRAPIAIIPVNGNLANDADRAAVMAEVIAMRERMRSEFGVPLGWIAVDTMLAAFGMQDEGDSAEAQRIVNVMRAMGLEAGCPVAPIHHVGKDGTQGMRGSSAFYAAADYVVICGGTHDHETGETSNRYLAIDKSRNDATGPVCNTELQMVDLGLNAYGEMRRTCVYVQRDGVVEPKPRAEGKAKRDNNDAWFHQAYDMIISRNKAKPEDGVTGDELRLQFITLNHAESMNSKNKAWGRTKDRMTVERSYRYENGLWFRETKK